MIKIYFTYYLIYLASFILFVFAGYIACRTLKIKPDQNPAYEILKFFLTGIIVFVFFVSIYFTGGKTINIVLLPWAIMLWIEYKRNYIMEEKKILFSFPFSF